MKSIRTVAILSAAIPLALFAQSGSASSPASAQSRPGSSQSGSSQSDLRSSGMNHSGNTSNGSASRVTKDSLKSQVTAKNLLGKDVYDNAGKKVGSVEDIVLPGAGSSLAGAFTNRDSSSNNSTRRGSMSGTGSTESSRTGSLSSSKSGTSTGAANSSGSMSGSTGSGSGSYAGSSGMTSDSTASEMSSRTAGSQSGRSAQAGSSYSQEPAVIISTGGFAGIGGTMLRVPMSQISYDSKEERFTLAMSEAELNQLKDSGDLASRGMN